MECDAPVPVLQRDPEPRHTAHTLTKRFDGFALWTSFATSIQHMITRRSTPSLLLLEPRLFRLSFGRHACALSGFSVRF